MGVKGLKSYLENHCQSTFSLQSIAKLAEEKRSYRDQELIIVVDGMNCVRTMYADLSWIGGAQLKEFAVKVQKFVEAFQNIGIRLVFFFDSPAVVSKNRAIKVERKMVTMEKLYTVLDKIDRGEPSDSISLKDYSTLPSGINHIAKYILRKMSECDVYIPESECDEEIARFARSKGVFGVLGQDTDFIIFDIGQTFYFDTDHLDLTTMMTRVYYPEVLAQSLGLSKSQLPVLATLMGNDIVSLDDLRDFHSKVNQERRRNLKRLVPNISSFIQNLPIDFIHDKVLMRKLAIYVFNSESRAQDIKTSVISYKTINCTQEEEAYQNRENCNESQRRGERSGGVSWGDHWSRRGGRGQRRKEIYTNWRQENRENQQEPCTETEEDKMWFEVVRKARQPHGGKKLPAKLYAVVKGLQYSIGTSFEDYRITPRDLPVWAELTQELRQRMYGILLQEKPVRPGSHEVEEWCMAGPGSLDEAKYNAAVMPSTVHPGLITLLSDQDRPLGALSDVRWTLFVHSVSPHLDVDKVRQLPSHLVITTMALHYIVHFRGPGRLEEWEADVVLATAAVIRHYGPSELSEIAADPMTSRSIRVSHIVMRFSSYIKKLVAASGFPLSREQTNPWNYFDGKLFQMKYREAEQLGVRVTDSWLCDNREDSLQDFRQARNVIFDDSCN